MPAQLLQRNDPDDVAVQLRAFIAAGRFVPNERLVEADLATALHTNRANVRIALGMLDREGLVVRERNRGARVRRVSDAEAMEVEADLATALHTNRANVRIALGMLDREGLVVRERNRGGVVA